MIRLIIWITKLVVALAMTLLFASCAGNPFGVKGSGKIVTRERSISEAFSGIDAGNGLEVRVSEGGETKISVSADDNIQDLITLEVEGNVLKIRAKSYSTEETPVVTVQTADIELIKASSGASVKTTSSIKGNKFTCDSSSGSTITAEAEADDVRLTSSSGSSIKIKGKSLKTYTDASSGSSIDASGLVANNVTSVASSGSTTEIAPILELKADASSGSSILYAKKPNKVDAKVSSGGSVGAN